MFTAQAVTNEKGYVLNTSFRVDDTLTNTGDIRKVNTSEFGYRVVHLGDLRETATNLLVERLLDEGFSLHAKFYFGTKGMTKVLKEITDKSTRTTALMRGSIFHIGKESNTTIQCEGHRDRGNQ